MKRENRFLRRLKSRAGETITEVLIATLVSALGMALLAGMITASLSIMNRSRETALEYFESENALETRSDDSGHEGTVTLTGASGGVKLTDDDAAADVPVSYVSRQIGKTTAISYSRK